MATATRTFHAPPKRYLQRDKILEWICRFAKENCGVTPSLRVIAAGMDMGKSTVEVHVNILVEEERLEWIEGRLKVCNSSWYEPDDVQI